MLIENKVIEIGMFEYIVKIICVYCGVGCFFDVYMCGEEVVCMVFSMDGKVNWGYSCVKGCFVWGYVMYQDRKLELMICENISDFWCVVSWDEVLGFVVDWLCCVQVDYGCDSIGVIILLCCINEEIYLVQKLVCVVFGNNNIDICVCVCYLLIGYGLKIVFGILVGMYDFDLVEDIDLVLVIGVNLIDGYLVFGLWLCKWLWQGVGLIVIDLCEIDLLYMLYMGDSLYLLLWFGINVVVVMVLVYVIVVEKLYDEVFICEKCDWDEFLVYVEFVLDLKYVFEEVEKFVKVLVDLICQVVWVYVVVLCVSIYYGLGVIEYLQGLIIVMVIVNFVMMCGNIGVFGIGVNLLCGQNNVQGFCDMGSFLYEYLGYCYVSDLVMCELYQCVWGVELLFEFGLCIFNMFDEVLVGCFCGFYCQGEDIV